jgi:iron complex outermembrane recepter protein
MLKCSNSTKLLVIAFILISSFCDAQSNLTLKGSVVDSTSAPLEGAIIGLLAKMDSSLVQSELTDGNGQFILKNMNAGEYFILAELIGYQSYSSIIFEINESQSVTTRPAIVLKSLGTNTTEVVSIQSTLRFVERKIDRLVVHPDALISNAGTTALEVIDKSPGVQVDINGNISLQGKSGVVVYVDDKPTYLSSADLANYLRGISSSNIQTIEIMTNPPAKYDAAGNVGIINIRLKKNKTEGLNGSFNISYGQGFYLRNNYSLNFNYRINKFNFFSNFSYGLNNNYQDLNIIRNYFNADGQLHSIFNQQTFIKMQNKGYNTRIGADYYINEKSTLGIALSGFENISQTHTANVASLFDSTEVLSGIVNADSPTRRIFKNKGLNLNYTFKIDTLGKEINFNADIIGYDSKLSQSLLSKTYLADQSFVNRTNLISDLPSTIEIKTAKVDYTHPLPNGAVFETGAKSSLIHTNNVANFYDEENGVLTVNNTFTNNFKYDENINAAYINYNIQLKKLGVQSGLRFENTFIKGKQIGTQIRPDSSFTRKYNSLFPTLYLSYSLDSLSKHQLGFSFGRRIDRPNYEDMNPFTYPLDRFTLYAGNPYLQPTFSNNIELSYTYNNQISSTLAYSNTNNVITETIEQNTNIFYSRPGNIGKSTSYGLKVEGSWTIKKKLTLQFYTEIMHNEYKSILYRQKVDNRGTYWYIGPTIQWQITNLWSAEMTVDYQTAAVSGQFRTIPVGSIRMGTSLKVLKNKGTIRVHLNDAFYSNQPGGDIKSLYNSTASWLSYLDSRVLTVSFGYRFNRGQSLTARQSGASDSEKSRVH